MLYTRKWWSLMFLCKCNPELYEAPSLQASFVSIRIQIFHSFDRGQAGSRRGSAISGHVQCGDGAMEGYTTWWPHIGDIRVSPELTMAASWYWDWFLGHCEPCSRYWPLMMSPDIRQWHVCGSRDPWDPISDVRRVVTSISRSSASY